MEQIIEQMFDCQQGIKGASQKEIDINHSKTDANL